MELIDDETHERTLQKNFEYNRRATFYVVLCFVRLAFCVVSYAIVSNKVIFLYNHTMSSFQLMKSFEVSLKKLDSRINA